MVGKRCITKLFIGIKGQGHDTLKYGAMWGGAQRHFKGELFVETKRIEHPINARDFAEIEEEKSFWKERGHKVRKIVECQGDDEQW